LTYNATEALDMKTLEDFLLIKLVNKLQEKVKEELLASRK